MAKLIGQQVGLSEADTASPELSHLFPLQTSALVLLTDLQLTGLQHADKVLPAFGPDMQNALLQLAFPRPGASHPDLVLSSFQWFLAIDGAGRCSPSFSEWLAPGSWQQQLLKAWDQLTPVLQLQLPLWLWRHAVHTADTRALAACVHIRKCKDVCSRCVY